MRSRQFKPNSTFDLKGGNLSKNEFDNLENKTNKNILSSYDEKPKSPLTKTLEMQRMMDGTRLKLKSPVSTGGTDEEGGLDSARSVINNFDDEELSEQEEGEVYSSPTKKNNNASTTVSENILERNDNSTTNSPSNTNKGSSKNKKKRAEREKKRNNGKQTGNKAPSNGSSTIANLNNKSNRPMIKGHPSEMEKVENILASYGSTSFTAKLKNRNETNPNNLKMNNSNNVNGNNNNNIESNSAKYHADKVMEAEGAVVAEAYPDYTYDSKNSKINAQRNQLIQKHLAHTNTKKEMATAQIIADLEAKANEGHGAAEKVTQLSEEIVSLKSRLVKETMSNENLHQQLKESTKRWGSQQRQWAQAMKEKEEDMSKQLLSLEARFHSELASRAPSKLPNDKNYGPNKELIKSIEDMQKDFDIKQQKWNEERSALIEKHRSEMIQIKDGFQSQAARPKETIMRLEDMIQALQAQITEMASDINTANARGEELKRRLQEADYRKNHLESEVKVLQQSLTSVTSVGEAGSSESSLHTLRSTSNAHIRQLSAEVEFLKAQLASESQCKEELVFALSKANEANATAKSEYKKILHEQDSNRKREIAAFEAKFSEDILGDFLIVLVIYFFLNFTN